MKGKIFDIKKHIEQAIAKTIKKSFGLKESPVISVSPNIDFGDFAFECFLLAKQAKKNPVEVAKTIAETIKSDKIIDKAVAMGPYVNFVVKREALFGAITGEWDIKPEKKEKIMIEYLSPNTNKPLHLGHLRNGSLGTAIANILASYGHKIIKANLVNDRGVHICKSMLAWQKWADGATPESTSVKGDHFVGNWYVRFSKESDNNKNLEIDAQDMLVKWEQGDKEIIKLWKTMNGWVYEGFSQTYKNFGLDFDVFFYESDTYKLGKDIIEDGLKKKVFYKDDRGAVVFDLPVEEFGKDQSGEGKKMTVLRADGTSVYITQDLGTAKLRAEKYELDRSIYVVGSEQNYHLSCLFKILSSLGYKWASKLHHLSYNMVYLPDGKMKSREGKVVDADDLIAGVEEIIREEIKKKDPTINNDDIGDRAHKIAVGAIKFYLLRVAPNQDIHFDPKESVAIDGFTGPYCQYAYVRAQNILRQLDKKVLSAKPDFSLLTEKEEVQLALKIFQLPDEIIKAGQEFNPSRLAIHIFEIAKSFNQFYHKCNVSGIDNERLKISRAKLVASTARTIKQALSILGIETVEKM